MFSLAQQPLTTNPGTPVDPSIAPLPNPQELLAQALQTLEAQRSVSARLLVGVNLYGEQMIGSGTYREEEPARSRRLRLEINIQHGDQVARVLKVCDGKHFWDYQQIFLDRPPRLASYDIERIERALRKAGKTPGQDGEPWPLTAGMVKLLRALRDVFVFDTVQPGKLDQTPVWKIEGGWRPEWLVQLMPDQKNLIEQKRPIDSARFAPQQPDRMALFLRQADLFPYRLEWFRTASAPDDDPQSPNAGRTVLVYLQLDPVELNVPIDPAHFNYNPGDVKFPDSTDAFLRQRNLRD